VKFSKYSAWISFAGRSLALAAVAIFSFLKIRTFASSSLPSLVPKTLSPKYQSTMARFGTARENSTYYGALRFNSGGRRTTAVEEYGATHQRFS